MSVTARIAVGFLVLCLIVGIAPVSAKDRQVKHAEEEIEFGFKAAKRGYWQEALERFELAAELTPNQPRILNNIAVALEANGRFDEARTTYETALALDPGNSALRKNFERFKEFHTRFVAVAEEGGDGEDGVDAEEPDSEDDDES